MNKRCLAFLLACALTVCATWSSHASARQYLKKSDDWFKSEEGRRVTENILSWQTVQGSWPKNMDTTKEAFKGDRKTLSGTFDNGATMDELRFLARAYKNTRDERLVPAFVLGLDSILKAQYPTGGWPQFYPPPERSYHRHITFNDGSMVRIMEFLREVAGSADYPFVGAEHKSSAQAAFDRGIACILKCQIKVKGKLTGWCAQHDEKDYQPRSARAYELVSLSGAESVGIVKLLMSLEHPSAEVIQAVKSAMEWFEAAKLTGLKEVQVPDPKSPKGKDKRIVKDPSAPPLWARFYEIETNRPIFCDRDGQKKYELAEIGYERRNGYAWLGNWPENLLNKEYPAWLKKQAGP